MATLRTTEEHGRLVRHEPAFLTSPFAMMRRLSDEMEHVFEDVWGGRRWFPTLWHGLEFGGRWAPEIEIFERKGELVVRADLPGLTKDDVKVEITDNELLIEGERKEEKEQKEKGYYSSERSYGAFSRRIVLPEGVKGDQARAFFKEGVLEITMPAPKVPEKHGRRLDIKAA